MKVLMIAPQPFFEPRGTPISIYQRLRGLSALGYEVHVVTYHIGKEIALPGVTIYRTPSLPFINNVRVGPSSAKIPLDILLFFRALWLLLTNRYHIIHTHEEASFFGPVFSALFRLPHIYDMHSSLPKQLRNFEFCDYRPVVKLFELLESWVLKTSDVVLTVGLDLEEYVAEKHKYTNQIRIENTIAHIDDEDSSLPSLMQNQASEGRLTVVYTGTLERYQGLDLLFESAQILQQIHPELVWIIVGGRAEQIEFWRNEVTKQGLQGSVKFVGTVSLEESLRYLNAAEILVSPRTEGLSVPLKIYSYLHSGKPIVATDIQAHTQVLSDETAVLTSANASSFADGILSLVGDPSLRSQLGRQAREFADRNFSFDCYLAKLERAYLAAKLNVRIADISRPEAKQQPRSVITAGRQRA